MKKKSCDRKPRLNKKQRAWVNSFMASRPNSKLVNIYDLLDGDRVVKIEWWEWTNPVILNPKTKIQGRIYYSIRVKLRKFGDPRNTAEFSYRIYPPEKQIVDNHLTGQLSLELSQCYEIPMPNNPIIVKPKREVKARREKKIVQHKLPLMGVAAKLHQINIRNGGIPKSEQELLLEITTHYDLDNKEIKLPSAIVQILQDKKASLDEWESAISLYQVGGASCVLKYLESVVYCRNNNSFNFQTTTDN